MNKTATAVLAGALLLTQLGCQPAKTPEQIAQCSVEKASLKALFDAGLTKEKGGSLAVAAECTGFSLAPRADAAEIKNLMLPFLQKMEAYRQGRYAGLVPAIAQVPSGLGDVGLLMEEAYGAREEATRCGVAEAAVIATIGQLDGVIVLGSITSQAGISSQAAAKAAAAVLLPEAERQAALSQGQSCDTSHAKARLQRHAAEWQDFYQGKHPWLPGCKIEPEGADLTLRCGPGTAKPS